MAPSPQTLTPSLTRTSRSPACRCSGSATCSGTAAPQPLGTKCVLHKPESSCLHDQKGGRAATDIASERAMWSLTVPSPPPPLPPFPPPPHPSLSSPLPLLPPSFFPFYPPLPQNPGGLGIRKNASLASCSFIFPRLGT